MFIEVTCRRQVRPGVAYLARRLFRGEVYTLNKQSYGQGIKRRPTAKRHLDAVEPLNLDYYSLSQS